MHDHEHFEQLLQEIEKEVQEMEPWMKSQEPSPGVSYEEWVRLPVRKEECTQSQGRVVKV